MHKELLEYIVKQLVNNPANVEIAMAEGDATNSFEIKVNQEDRGRVIGREGQTIRAIRTLLIAAAPAGTKVSVSVVD